MQSLPKPRHGYDWKYVTRKKTTKQAYVRSTEFHVSTKNMYSALCINDDSQSEAPTTHSSSPYTLWPNRKYMEHKPNPKAKRRKVIHKRSGKTIQDFRGNESDVSAIKDKNKINICLWNCQSARQKTEIINDYKLDNCIDIYLLVESWLKEEGDEMIINKLKHNNTHNVFTTPRPYDQNGGGICALTNSNLNVKKMEPPKVTSMEVMELLFTIFSKKITIVTIYRSESSKVHKYTMQTFFRELNELCAYYHLYKNEIIICGDFNIHVNKPKDKNTIKLNTIIDTFDLTQHINQPTHRLGNTLDLVITRKQTLMKGIIIGEQLSDHNNVIIQLDLKKPPPLKKEIRTRKLKSMNINNFKVDLRNTLNIDGVECTMQPKEKLDELINVFNSSVNVLDKHAPLQQRTITVREPTPWGTADIRYEKRKRRKLEKRWKKSKLSVDYELYKEQKNKVNTLLTKLKNESMAKIIQENAGDSRTLFKVVNNAVKGKQETPLPEHTDDGDLANDFNHFFTKKVATIRSKFDKNHKALYERKTFTGTPLNEFKSLTTEQVKVLILKQKCKHNLKLDPVPVYLMKECIDEYLPIITKIINTSLEIGVVPNILKHALIKPLLKKLNLELQKKNYRPVSNLSFISKLIEAAVLDQYTEHLSVNNIHDIHQSAYKKFHSTETLLTKVQSDILMQMDKGKLVMVVLLDLSAAFDTIDHNILLTRLQNRYGVGGKALEWFQSYLCDRTQSVIINDTVSEKQKLHCGVPQGSKLGPILFNCYIAPLNDIISKHLIDFEKYADDNQLIMAFCPDSVGSQMAARQKMISCINDVRTFLDDNKLSNNGEKTEFLIAGTKQQLKKLVFDTIEVGDVKITKMANVRDLGIKLDEHMSMVPQVNQICRTGYYHLKNFASFRRALSKKDTETIIHAFVTSILDNGNSLLYGISKKYLNKLQVLQNSAARVVENLQKYDHITETRKKLHWLPVEARIIFKILKFTWQCLNNMAPIYLTNLIKETDNGRNLRNNKSTRLKVPRINRITLGGRAFEYAAPMLWNTLPDNVKHANTIENFKSRLKTHLFDLYYN